MPEVTTATATGWAIMVMVFYVIGEYTSVLAKTAYPIKWFKGRPARLTTGLVGGFFGGVYAGGFLWSAAASFIGAGALAGGGTVVLGLTGKETLVVFLAALVVGLALYTGAAAEEAVDAD
ncbi:hypothetical protein G9463_11005 [Haloarcula sp. JP-Z28]|uniref:hypothetical protein n=1 Tax=Haloarcula TaxID=2237 RepID=UPI000321760D|nr:MULTISPECIES: hypothetical protein [Haloarcula]NHN63822.1 hypothetical protein [Haloarcula sp. JP-Z28]